MPVKFDKKPDIQTVERKIKSLKQQILELDGRYAKIQGKKVAAYSELVKMLTANNTASNEKAVLELEKKKLLGEIDLEYKLYKSQRDAIEYELKPFMVSNQLF